MKSDYQIKQIEPKINIVPILLFVGAGFLEAIVQLIFQSFDKNQDIDLFDSITWFVGKLVTLVIIILLWKKDFFNTTKEVKRNFGLFLIYVAVAFGIFYLFNIGANYYSALMDKVFNVGESTNQEMIYDYFAGSKTTINYVLLFITIVILAPLLEELVYRELIFKTFKKANWVVPLIFSSLLFGFAHMTEISLKELSYLPAYLIPGIGLGIIYHFSKNNFFVSFSSHMFINLIAFIQIMIQIINQTNLGGTI